MFTITPYLQERSNLEAALQEDQFRLTENQLLSGRRSSKNADPYNLIQESEYYENSFSTEDTIEYFPGQFNHSNKAFGNVNKASSAFPLETLPHQDEAHRKLVSSNPQSTENQSYANSRSVENQWEASVQSSELKRDASSSSHRSFARAVNSITASQHLQQ